jgi:GntR family transcriptional regulator/MocR family aminotransferase
VLSNYQEYIFERSSNQGSEILRNAISRYLKRSRGISVHSDQIVIGSGAEYLYGLIAQMLTDKRIGIEDPSYEKIEKVYRAHGLEIERLKMGKDGIRSTELERAKVLTLHVTPYSSFPTKITADASKRSQYISWAKDRNGLIIEDDYDSEFSLTGTAPETLFAQSMDENVIYLNTFSKTIAPSLRAGYMILPEKWLPVYQKTVGFYSCTVPMLEQYFLAEWLDSGEFERTISRMQNQKRD